MLSNCKAHQKNSLDVEVGGGGRRGGGGGSGERGGKSVGKEIKAKQLTQFTQVVINAEEERKERSKEHIHPFSNISTIMKNIVIWLLFCRRGEEEEGVKV